MTSARSVAAGEPTLKHYANPLLRGFAATRPAFLSITLIACLIGLAAAYADGVAIDVLRAVVTVITALIAHAACNVINDFHDAASGTDAGNSRRIFPYTGGSRFIQNSVISTRNSAILGYGLLAAVIPAGLWLTTVSAPPLLLIGISGLAMGWAYSAPPLHLVARGFGELVVTACWLLVVVGADYVQRGTFAWTPAAAGLSFALLVANLLYINQFPDHDSDAASGKHTMVVRLGPESAKWGYFGIALIAYAWLIIQVGRDNLPQVCAAATITITLSLTAARQLREHASDPEALAPAIRLTIAAALTHGLLLATMLAFNWR